MYVGNVWPDRSHSKTITRSECGNISHISTDQQPAAATGNAKKFAGIDLFQTPRTSKKITFGCRHIACMLYITHYLSISNVPISPPCVDYRPTKSSLSFFCHDVTPCVSRVCRVLCRNVDFYSIRMRKRKEYI